jgi:murein L,D-transpeptidase YafK
MKASHRGSSISHTLVLLLLAVVCLPGWAKSPNPSSAEQADRIVIVKSQRTLTLYRQGQVLKTYKVALGSHPVGPKTQQGDHRTPEGVYTIDSRNSHSQYHLSLHISYPNAEDRVRAKKLRVNPGGDIFIHGLPPAYSYLGPLHRKYDWTWGCVAVTDQEIEEIWSMVPNGTTVEIKP